MTKGISVEMDSYRLASYAIQVPCYICGQDNGLEAELCRQCCAPLALAHQARNQKTPPQIIAALGSSGVGKTVYLGMLLDMLSRQSDRLQVLARGAFSLTLQQTTVAAMDRCQFPSKTPNEPDRWNWVHCQVMGHQWRRPIELVVPDLAGESLFEEVEHPHSYEAIRALLIKSTAVLVLIDAHRLQGGVLDQDYFSMKLLSYLGELVQDPKRSWRNRPIALVFSKADQCEECFEDPAEYARRHTPGLWKFCHERFEKFKFFAAGVAGACASRTLPGGSVIRVPLRIEPRGIIDPFEWLVEKIRH